MALSIRSILLFHLIFLIHSKKTLQKSCNSSEISFFQLLRSCPDGIMGQGPDCACHQKDCRVAYMRSYLPPMNEDWFRAFNKSSRQNQCDDAMGRQFSNYLMGSFSFVKLEGYPVGYRCSTNLVSFLIRNKTYHQCTHTLGKYIRYNSLYLYHLFSQLKSKILVDISYSVSWRSTRGIPHCSGMDSNHHGWRCFFNDLSTTAPTNTRKKSHAKISKKLIKKIDNIRSTKLNHAVQILLYGRLLLSLVTPNKMMIEFASRHRVTVNAVTSENGNSGDFPTVSMHVRQGDSCDFIVSSEKDYSTGKLSYLNKSLSYRRPCYSVDVYMKKLYRLQSIYGVKTVYLATDSEEMIRRVHTETRFTWVFINITRQIFDYKATTIRDDWVDFYSDDENGLASVSAVADLLLMKSGDIFLGAFTSHFSKLSYYLMAGSQMRIPPFISVDYPLSCGTTDHCSDRYIRSNNRTIEEIIKWTPECLRRSSGGWLADDADDCGLYTTAEDFASTVDKINRNMYRLYEL